MDDRPHRIADYFVVVGLGGSSATKFEPFPPAEDVEGVTVDHRPSDSCDGVEPLTDISIIHSKLEQLPQGYKSVKWKVTMCVVFRLSPHTGYWRPLLGDLVLM